MKENCPSKNECGLVQWLKEYRDTDNCGTTPDECPRLDPKRKLLVGIKLEVETYGPGNDEEIKKFFPEIPNDNDRPKRRSPGGCAK